MSTLLEKQKKYVGSFFKAYRFRIENIKNIHETINQLIKQWHTTLYSSNISISYLNDSQVTFNSFENFNMLSEYKPNQISSISVDYNFLILLPNSQKPQRYKISITLLSALARRKELTQDINEMNDVFFHIKMPSAAIKVEYTDYVVATTIMKVTEECLEKIDFSDLSWYIKFLQSKIRFVRPAVTNGLILLVSFFIYYRFESIILDSTTKLDMAQLTLEVSVFIYFIYTGSNFLGRKIVEKVRAVTADSYIEITSGDKRCISEHGSQNRNKIFQAAVWVFATIVCGIASNLIVKFM